MKRIEDLHVLINRIPHAEGNIGEEAILASLLQDLRACGVRNISVLSNQPERTRMRHGNKVTVVSDDPGNWLTMPFTISKYDLLIWGGGHMLQDRSSQFYIPFVTKTLLLAKMRGVPRFIYAPGLGPVVNRLGKFLSKLAIDGSGTIIVRDHGSARLLKEIGVKGEIFETADPGFSLENMHRTFDSEKSESPVVGFAPRKLFYRKGSMLPVSLQRTPSRGTSRFEQFITEAAAALDLLIEQRNARIVLIPMDVGPNPRDDLVCQQIRDHMMNTTQVKIYDDDPALELFISRLAELDLLVSARLHGIILGFRFGLPFIGIDSDGKVFRLAKKIGVDGYVIKDADVCQASLYDLMCRALDNKENLTRKFLERGAQLKTEAQQNRHLLNSYLSVLCSQNDGI